MMEGAARDDADARRHEARTRLNHIVGYCDILRQDVAEDGHGELAELFGRIGDSAVSLREPLAKRLGPALSQETAEALDSQLYGILFELVAMVQDAKGKVACFDDDYMSSDVDKLIEAGNAILELLSREGNETGRAVDGTEGARIAFAEADLPKAPRPGRILIVDDDPLNRELLSRHLGRQGHDLTTVADGPSALKALAAESFDIAVIDVMMPGMNGFQLLEKLRASDGLSVPYIIVISALDDTQSIARCIQLGAEDYLPREFEPVILKARIESCLEKKRLKEEQELYVFALLEAQERLRSELRDGASYVRSLLPPRLSSPAISSDWMFIPSASLGGDVFGYHRLDGGTEDQTLAIYLVDVSGHGIEAALFSVSVVNLLKTRAPSGAESGDPAAVLGALNAAFKMEEQNNLFFSAWYGVWNSGSRELRYASAGGPPAVLALPGGGCIELETGGPIIGADPDSVYGRGSAIVPPLSRLYLFSDGIYEFRTKDGHVLGLEPFIRELAGIAAQAIDGESSLDRLLARAQTLAQRPRFADDVSLLEFRFG
ncbi:MAG: fused response regulator/phosphatase [Spirochaetaceae bacterium]|nr:fused response regulator/phosphatase [Spirochaetaceae bacterium]